MSEDNNLGIYEWESKNIEEENPIPIHNVRELIEWLDNKIPAKCPNLDDTERYIFFYAGKRDLIDFLKREYDRQFKESR
jgi:hypothetical protein